MDRESLSKEYYEHLTEDIIPFWAGLRDDEYGGFYGQVDFDHMVDKKADKGCILNSRIMWFFSAAKLLFDELDRNGTEKEQHEGYAKYSAMCLDLAGHAYRFFREAFLDGEYGGVYWAVSFDGRPADTLKHTYCHAFAIYALAAYFDASGERAAFDTAMELADLIEEKCTDDVGYLEAFNRDFTPARNDELSENGVMADKTMNTLLHVFEAYTELLRVVKKRFPAVVKPVRADENSRKADAIQTGNAGEAGSGTKNPVTGYSPENVRMAARLANRMKFILDIFTEKIYNPKLRRQEVFFDSDYNPIIDLHSYGHDIETSWLLDRGLEILSDVDCSNEIEPITLSLAEKIYERAYVRHSLLNECEKGVDDKRRIWWVQAETVIGFMHASQKIERKKDKIRLTMKASGIGAKERQETEVEAERRAAGFFMASVDVWEFIREKVVDRRSKPAEWYSELDDDFEPIRTKNLADPWKCPYHNGRMCIEMIRRLRE